MFCNSFYASKIMIFNELYNLCRKINVKYDKVLDLMLKNGWINEMHTKVPGTDKMLAYGGMCFPKDTKALRLFMEKMGSSSKILSSVISEWEKIRGD